MVNDPRRTPALLTAVAAAVRPGDAVLDIGTGLGLLAIAAAEAGARQVWACDVDRAALAHAKQRAREAGVADRIAFIRSLSFDLDLPERADVVLCETVGSFAFDENILATLDDAKRRLLRCGGRIVPQQLELWGAPVSRVPKLEQPAEIGRVQRRDLLAEPQQLAAVEFGERIPATVHVRAAFRCARSGTVRALAVWPRAIWRARHISDASPLVPPTHWQQGILPLEERRVAAGDRPAFEIVIGPHPDDPQQMTERLWRWI